MEDDITQNGRRPHPKWKMTKKEDDQKGKRTKKEDNQKEEDQKGR